MDPLALGLFLVSATALLGTPGPGIAALVAVGRAYGLSRGLRYYAGLQVGLAAAAAVSAAGLLSVLQAFPAALRAMVIVAIGYLVYLAFRIATAPVGVTRDAKPTATSPLAGLLLGVTNPKAYVAFATLYASQRLVLADARVDALLKWALCVVVIVVVDLAWLLVGVALNRTSMRPGLERLLNATLAGAMLVAVGLSLR